MIVLSFDGFLYTIDGATGCADTIDISAFPALGFRKSLKIRLKDIL